MRYLPALAALVAAAACTKHPQREPARAEPTPAPPVAVPAPSPLLAAESAWTARSADGRIAVAQTAVPGGGCSLVATEVATGAALWSAGECAAWRTDPVFVSNGGNRLLVLHARAHPGAADWSSVAVASLLERGRVVRTFRGDDLVDRAVISGMRPEENWARGLREGSDESRPRYEPGGERVRIETADGGAIRVGFDGTVARAGAAGDTATDVAGPPRDDEAGLYRWVDAAGEVHYTNGAEVPERYRPRAEPVRAQVSVVAVERVSPGFAPSRAYRSPASGSADARPAGAARPPVRQPAAPNHFQRSLEAAANAAMGVDTSTVNTRPQVCTTRGDITECRNAR